MNIATVLLRRRAEGRPVTAALIGAGKVGTMFLAQARTTPGLQAAAVADLDRARSQLRSACWPEQHCRHGPRSPEACGAARHPALGRTARGAASADTLPRGTGASDGVAAAAGRRPVGKAPRTARR